MPIIRRNKRLSVVPAGIRTPKDTTSLPLKLLNFAVVSQARPWPVTAVIERSESESFRARVLDQDNPDTVKIEPSNIETEHRTVTFTPQLWPGIELSNVTKPS